jgi:hypothetical protein
MPKSLSKNGGGSKTADASPANILSLMSLNPQRAGLPAPESIVGVRMAAATLALADAAGAGATQYRIIETNEMDEYEKGADSPEKFAAISAAAMAEAAPAGDKYQGKDRKAAKLSIAKATMETFSDVKDLIESLVSVAKMKKHKPPIGRGADSGRVEEEQRNIRVNAFLYAASRENDNDFHLIIGRDPEETPEMYMTMELSGLPPANSASFKKLNAARNSFKKFYHDFLNTNLPGLGYQFPDPPVPVLIEGSLFFDVTHSTGPAPGPKSLKSRMPTIWEVHPITKMVFKP